MAKLTGYSVNVEADLIVRMHEQAVATAKQAAKLSGLEATALEATAAAQHAEVRRAIIAATSLPDDQDPATIEPVTMVPVSQADQDRALAEQVAAGWAYLRAERAMRLAQSDWTHGTDSPLTEKEKAAWAAYRQALRDLPAHTKDPRSVVWPEEPGAN